MLKSAKVRFATLEWLEERRLMSGTPQDPGGQSGDSPGTGVSPTVSNFHVESGSNGWFTQIVYNGVHYVDEALRRWSTEPWFIVVTTDMNGGDRRAYTSRATSHTYNPQTRTLVQQFPEAKLTWTYATRENQVSWDVTVENTMTDRKLVGYNLLITSVKFSSTNFERVGPRNVWGTSGGVQATRINDGDNAVYIINDNPGTQHMLHFQQFAGSEQRGEYRIRVGNARLWGDGATYPVQDSVIILEPGQTDRVALSLKFAPAAASTLDANPDLLEDAVDSNPFRLNWADRRPIGANWLHGGNHPLAQIDTSTPAGVAEYQRVAIATAHLTVQQALREDLQGVIFWDIEGTDQFRNPDPYAYAGDPRLLPTLNPAFDAIADQFFQIIRDAGIRIGFTIRNSELVQTETSWRQTEPADPAASYKSKISYAKQRWGATLFYVDSGQAHDITPLNQAAQAHPDVLLMPEALPSMSVGFHAFAAPMLDQRFRGWATAEHVREQYPDAFSVVWVGDTVSRRTEEGKAIMRQAVINGDILMAHVGGMMDISEVAASAGVPLIRPQANPNTPSNPPPTDPPANPPANPNGDPTTPNPVEPGTPQNNNNPSTPPSTNNPATNPNEPTSPPTSNPDTPPANNGTQNPTTPTTPTAPTNPSTPTGPTGGNTGTTPPTSTPTSPTTPPTSPPTSTPSTPPTSSTGNSSGQSNSGTAPTGTTTTPPPTTPPPATPRPSTPPTVPPPGNTSAPTTPTPPSTPPSAPTAPSTPPSPVQPPGPVIVIPEFLPPIQPPVVPQRPAMVLRPRDVVPAVRVGPSPSGVPLQSAPQSPVVLPPATVSPGPTSSPRPSQGTSTRISTAEMRGRGLAAMAPSLLRNWSLKQASVARSVASAPVVRTSAPTYVAPILTGRVKVNPLAISNSPTLFSSSSLDTPASPAPVNPLDGDSDFDIRVGEAA
jgi:hypothetical protein